MERLTGRNEHGGIISLITGVHPDVERMRLLHRLFEFEDAEENGMLIRLPCKIGQMVFVLFADPDDESGIIRFEVAKIEMGLCQETEYWAIGDTDGWAGEEVLFTENEIGKTVFLSEPEARKALGGLK